MFPFQLNEQLQALSKDKDDLKAREIFHEAGRTLEMASAEDLQTLGETMFDGTYHFFISTRNTKATIIV